VTTLARHPLDVFVSILHFVRHELTHWLERDPPEEREIAGASPTSPRFVDYATSARATQLLGVTADWWNAADVHRLRYKSLVADPHAEARAPCETLEAEPAVHVDHAVEAARVEELRRLVTNNHFWQGKPGLWRRLVTADAAGRIVTAHERTFDLLGYTCDPDETLSAAAAEANWRQLVADDQPD
jgi:hypothetical protein